MYRMILTLTLFTPLLAQAAAPGGGTVDPFDVASILALGMGFVLLALVLFLAYFAIFIHLATRMVGLARPFGTAFRAEFIYIGLSILFGVATAILAPDNRLAQFLASWGAATGAIRIAYGTGFLRALFAAVLANVLTFVGTILTVIALIAIFGVTAPPQPAPAPPPGPPPAPTVKF